MVWHDISDPNDPQLDELAEKYKIHPLHIEDCRHRNQNAKVEEGRDYVFVVVKPVELQPDGTLGFGDLDLMVGREYLITVQEMECATIRKVITSVRATSEGQRPDQLLYRIIDGLVDSYAPLLDRYSDTIERLEESILDNATPEMLSQLFETRRGMVEMRRVISNTREVAGMLYRMRNAIVSSDLAPFFRDVYDHLVRAMDNIDIQRDLLSGVVEIYMSVMANRTNNVMKGLSVVGTIAVPALVISGFYGMNLKHLPLIDSPHATLLVALLLLVSTTGILLLLRKFRMF